MVEKSYLLDIWCDLPSLSLFSHRNLVALERLGYLNVTEPLTFGLGEQLSGQSFQSGALKLPGCIDDVLKLHRISRPQILMAEVAEHVTLPYATRTCRSC